MTKFNPDNPKCPKCGSRSIGKGEDIDGVEVDYNLEEMENGTYSWEEADMNFYGNTTVTYSCVDCDHEWK